MKNGSGFQPYILHTTDELLMPQVNGTSVPGHAIAFRTLDPTVTMSGPSGVPSFGGGKLGMYSFWPAPTGQAVPAITQPDPSKTGPANLQYEFYNYTGGNYGEVGNELTADSNYNPTGLSQTYLNAFNGIKNSELYITYYPYQDQGGFDGIYTTALKTYLNGVILGGSNPPTNDDIEAIES